MNRCCQPTGRNRWRTGLLMNIGIHLTLILLELHSTHVCHVTQSLKIKSFIFYNNEFQRISKQSLLFNIKLMPVGQMKTKIVENG